MNGVIEAANAIAAHWAEAMWPVLWQSTALAAVVFVLTLLLRRAPAALRFWLWMLVPLRLLVMPVATIEFPVLPVKKAGTVQGAAVESPTAPPSVPSREPFVSSSVSVPQDGSSLSAESGQETAPVVLPTVWTWLLALWAAGSAFFAFRLVHGWLAMRRIVVEAAETSDARLRAAVREAAHMMDLRRVPRVLVSSEQIPPFVMGLLRPAVVLPEGLVEKTSPDELRAVMAHEFAHLKRRDPFFGWILAFCHLLYFFHPVFYLAKRKLLFERERSCDEWVLADGKAGRGPYARALVAAAEVCCGARSRALPAVVRAESFSHLKKRLKLMGTALMSGPRLPRSLVAFVIAAVFLSAPGWALTRTNAPRAGWLSVNEREGFFGANRGKAVCAVLTDGELGQYKVSNTIFIGARWSGIIQPKNPGGTSIKVKSDLESLRVNNREYPLKRGRVFLISTAGGTVKTTQLKVPLKHVSGTGKAVTRELRKLSSTNKKLGKFLNSAGGDLVTYRGVVTDPSGQPLPDVQVHYEYQDVTAETETDASGRFEVGPVPAREEDTVSTLLAFDHPDYGVGWIKHGRSDVEPGDLSIQLRPARSVSGTVTDEQGNPVAGAQVRAELQILDAGGSYGYLDLAPRNDRGETTDAEGRFSFGRVPEGADVDVTVQREGYATYSTRDEPKPFRFLLKAGDKDVEITLKPGGSIEGHLVRDGGPYRKEGIRIEAYGPRGQEYTRTDGKGHYALKGLLPGTYIVFADDDDLQTADVICEVARNIEVSAGREPTRLDLTIISGILVTGRMIDSRTGKPARDGWLRVTLPGSPNVSLNSAQTNKEGEFELRLPPGEYEVRTYGWHDGTYRDRTWPLDLEEGTDRRELTLRYAERPGLDGRLVDRQGKPVKGKIMLGGGDPVETSAEGTFSIPEPRTEGQPEGWAVGWATNESRELARSFYWHRRERGKELEITLKPLSRVKGKLVNEAGEPVPKAEFDLWFNQPERDRRWLSPGRGPWITTLKSDGEFTVERMPAGVSMQMEIETKGHATTVALGQIEPGETRNLGEVVLKPNRGRGEEGATVPAAKEWNATISGTVVNQEDDPVTGATVRARVFGERFQDSTDLKGHFRLEELPADHTVDLTVSNADGYRHGNFEGIETGSEDVRLQIFPPAYRWHGKQAPKLLVKRWLNSEPLTLKELRGKVVLLQVGADITRPRAMHMDQVVEAATRYKDRAFQVIGVVQNRSDFGQGGMTEERISNFIETHRINFPLAEDGDPRRVPEKDLNVKVVNGATYSVYGRGMFLIDKKGILRCSPTRQNLDEWIKKLLAE